MAGAGATVQDDGGVGRSSGVPLAIAAVAIFSLSPVLTSGRRPSAAFAITAAGWQ